MMENCDTKENSLKELSEEAKKKSKELQEFIDDFRIWYEGCNFTDWVMAEKRDGIYRELYSLLADIKNRAELIALQVNNIK